MSNHTVDCDYCGEDLRTMHLAHVNMVHKTGLCSAPTDDTDRLIKFLHEQSDETDSDGLAQWFTAAANQLQILRDRVKLLESR